MVKLTQDILNKTMNSATNIGKGVGGVLPTKGTQVKKPLIKKAIKKVSSVVSKPKKFIASRFESAKKKVFGM